MVTNCMTDDCYVSNKTRERGYTFPLYLYSAADKNGSLFANGASRNANVNPKFVDTIAASVGLVWVDDTEGDLEKSFGPEDVFNYIYSILLSSTYRERYREFLKRDFPRVPLTSDKELFRLLCELGSEMVALHLLESPLLVSSNFITSYPVPGDDLIEKGHPTYLAPGDKEPGTGEKLTQGRVYISKDKQREKKQGQYFEGVPPEVWEFYVGGYQVCEKWLKDRRGRNLSYKDRVHYQKVVLTLKETIHLMKEIDNAIPSWPIT